LPRIQEYIYISYQQYFNSFLATMGQHQTPLSISFCYLLKKKKKQIKHHLALKRKFAFWN